MCLAVLADSEFVYQYQPSYHLSAAAVSVVAQPADQLVAAFYQLPFASFDPVPFGTRLSSHGSFQDQSQYQSSYQVQSFAQESNQDYS